MSSLLAAAAIPAAKSAIESARGVAASAGQSFADALRTAAEFCHEDSGAKGVDAVAGSEEADELADRVAARLQEILDGASAASGERFHLAFADGGLIEVTGDSPSLSAVQAAINDDQTLVADLWSWANSDGGSLDGQSRPSLTVEAA